MNLFLQLLFMLVHCSSSHNSLIDGRFSGTLVFQLRRMKGYVGDHRTSSLSKVKASSVSLSSGDKPDSGTEVGSLRASVPFVFPYILWLVTTPPK